MRSEAKNIASNDSEQTAAPQEATPEKIVLPTTAELQEAYDKVSYLDRLRKSIISTTNISLTEAVVA